MLVEQQVQVEVQQLPYASVWYTLYYTVLYYILNNIYYIYIIYIILYNI